MAKSTIVIITCDRCGMASMDGSDIHTVTISLPGKLSRMGSWELCGPCVDEVGKSIREHVPTAAPVEAPVEVPVA